MKLLLTSLLTAGMLPFALGQPGTTTRVSVSSAGVESNGFSWTPALSGDGRYVAFASNATNLVAGDTNGYGDIFVRDRQVGQTIRVSVSSAGLQANGGSVLPSMSSNGEYACFSSGASNLVAGDVNGRDDSFIHNLITGETQVVSTSSTGVRGNGNSGTPFLSAEGRFAAFVSSASNLVPDDTNGKNDVFVKDRQTGETRRVSISSAGAQGTGGIIGGNATYTPIGISADGRFVCFNSDFTNLVGGENNGARHVFVHDRQVGVTIRVSISSSGAQAITSSYEPSISGDGRYIVFSSGAPNLVAGDLNGFTSDVFLHDRLTGATSLVSLTSQGQQVNRDSRLPQISHDGRLVAFESFSDAYVLGDTNQGTDFFIKDRLTGNIRRVSLSSSGGQAFLGGVSHTSMSADGRVVAFSSESKNLVQNDTNNERDIFASEVGPTNELVGFSIRVPTLAGENRTIGTVQMGFPAVLRSDVITIVNSNHLIMPAQITIDAGAMSKSFAIQAMPLLTTINETVIVRYGFQSETAHLTLIPFVPSAIQFNPSPATGGQTVSCRLVMNGVAPSGGKVVTISDNSAFSSPPASVTVPAGASQVVFNIPTSTVTSQQFVTVTASVAQGSKTGLLVLMP